MNSIVLNKIVVNNNRVDYFFSVNGNLQKYFEINNHMFLQYNYDISNIPKSILSISFVSNVAPLIWITDSTILIDELDKSFYKCLDNIKTAYQNMFPNVRFKGKFIVEKIIDNSYMPEKEVACLFSGGLDAIATFTRIMEKKPLLITEYGWHEKNIQKSEVWEADRKNTIEFAEIYGLNSILIESNYGKFINAENIDYDFKKKLGDTWWHGLHHSLAIISAAIPVAFKLKIGCIYIASSFHKGYKAPCASDPTVDNEIRYASGSVFHDAYELTRQDKVKLVVDHYSRIKQPINIRVCFRKEENCCNCEKCMRTILGIIAEGKNPNDFGFNVSKNLSEQVQEFLKDNVKFFNASKIMAWNIIQQRMLDNQNNILYKDLLDWFLEYDFATQRKRLLLKYRVTKFFPIIKRKISIRINRILYRKSYR